MQHNLPVRYQIIYGGGEVAGHMNLAHRSIIDLHVLGLGEAIISPASIQLLHPAAATLVDTMVLVRAVAMRWRDLVNSSAATCQPATPGWRPACRAGSARLLEPLVRSGRSAGSGGLQVM